MGICEYSGDKNIVYTTKSLLDKTPGTKTTNFYFSTEPLSKLDGDCLLILSKDYQSIKNNRFIKNSSNKAIPAQICKEIQSQIKENKDKPTIDQFLIFNTYNSGLDFQKFAIICLEEKQYQQYQENESNLERKNQLIERLRTNITDIIKEGVLNLAITEFQWKSWISKISIFKQICKIIIGCKSFKSVVFACINEDTQSLYMKTVQQIKQESSI